MEVGREKEERGVVRGKMKRKRNKEGIYICWNNDPLPN
jgi:hypothetical protein